VLIPADNERDLKEIPDNIKADLEIIPVRWIDQVLEHALEYQPTPLSGDKKASSDKDAKQEDKSSDEKQINTH
jgi:ATP-dependent Lon protease